jgi:hypothetical protein
LQKFETLFFNIAAVTQCGTSGSDEIENDIRKMAIGHQASRSPAPVAILAILTGQNCKPLPHKGFR